MAKSKAVKKLSKSYVARVQQTAASDVASLGHSLGAVLDSYKPSGLSHGQRLMVIVRSLNALRLEAERSIVMGPLFDVLKEKE